MGLLDDISIYLSGFDCLTRLGDCVKTNNLHLAKLAGFFHSRQGTKRGIIIDAKNGIEIGMGLEDILGSAKRLIFHAMPAGMTSICSVFPA